MAVCKICNASNPGRKNYCGDLKDKNSCAYKHQLAYSREMAALNRIKYRKTNGKREVGKWALQWINGY